MIQVVRIRVSDWYSHALLHNEQVQDKLNKVIASVDSTRFTLQDVIVTPAVVHQLGGGNVVDLYYTLVFKQDGKGRGRES